MGIAERKQREKEQRRASIVAAAERVFFAGGLDQATMDDVAAEAELSKGLLYVYFESKEDLYDAVSLNGFRQLHAAIRTSMQPGMTGRERLLAMARTYAAFASVHPGYFEAIIYQAAQGGTDKPDSHAAACEAVGDRVLALVADTLQRGITDGSIRTDLDVRPAAIALWSQLHGVLQVAVLKNIQTHHRLTLDELVQAALDLIDAALRPR